MTLNPFSFAARLKMLREERSLSKTRLGEMVGVSTTCVWNWENGNTEPRAYNLNALSKALGVSIEYLEFGAKREMIVTFDKSEAFPAITLEQAIGDARMLIAKLANIEPKQVSITLNY